MADHCLKAIDKTSKSVIDSGSQIGLSQIYAQMALASVNYALAIWKDADENYVMLKRAQALAAEIKSQ